MLLSDYPIDRFVCQAVCIDAKGQSVLTPALLGGVDLRPDGAILFYTGLGDSYRNDTYATEYPKIELELANLLVEKGVKLVGVDMISFDHDEPYPIHKALLDNDVLLIENLINLERVAGKHFRLSALPVRLELHAAPARVIAEV